MTITDTQENPPAANAGLDDTGDDESWLTASNPRGVRVRPAVAALTLGIAMALGVWGGAKLESSQANTGATAAAARPTGGATGGGAAPGGGAGTAFAGRGGLTGTVASVHGDRLQLTTTDGSTVAVTFQPTTTVTKSTTASTTDITAGETITVRGQTAGDGSTAAQSISIVPTPAGG